MKLFIIIFASLLLFLLIFTSNSELKKQCLSNLTINGTNLITSNRKKLLVIGIVNFKCPSCWKQSEKFYQLYRDLQEKNMGGSSLVKLLLINEKHARHAYKKPFYQTIAVQQDNENDELIAKLGSNVQAMDILVFGRCGYLSSFYSNYPLEIRDNYNQLWKTIQVAVKTKRPCHQLCS